MFPPLSTSHSLIYLTLLYDLDLDGNADKINRCLAQRRRRKQRRLATSQTPMTAPANNNYYGGGAPQQQTYNAPPGPPPPNYGGANEGYYGQQNGIAQPQGAYVK